MAEGGQTSCHRAPGTPTVGYEASHMREPGRHDARGVADAKRKLVEMVRQKEIRSQSGDRGGGRWDRMPSSSQGGIVQGDTDGATVVTIVLSNDAFGAQFPEPGKVVGASRDEIGAVGAEGAVPHPSLMTL
jgi:hypothetical protein